MQLKAPSANAEICKTHLIPVQPDNGDTPDENSPTIMQPESSDTEGTISKNVSPNPMQLKAFVAKLIPSQWMQLGQVEMSI